MISYVAGFLFRQRWDGNLGVVDEVALIKKIKPEWQNGFLNGIGGKIEPGEVPLDAMIREFKEEAGEDIRNWTEFAIMNCGGNREGVIHFFVARNSGAQIQTMEKEEVSWFNIKNLNLQKTVPNIRFLVPMAFNFNGTTFEIKELCR